MGVVQNVSYNKFPKQGNYLNKRTTVCFNYDTSKTIGGTIIRDDREEPFQTIIKLDDGKVVLAEECQYSVPSIKQ